jgi:hypothetical protein
MKGVFHRTGAARQSRPPSGSTAIAAAHDTLTCKNCGKYQPKVLVGFHVSEICWCGYKRIGKRKWVYDGYAGHSEGEISLARGSANIGLG